MGYFRRTAVRDQMATSSYVTYYLSLVAVILRKENKYKSLSIYTFPFDTPTWTLILLFCGLIIIFNHFSTMRSRNNNFLIFEILFGMSINNVPKKSSKRIYFMSTLISSFFLRSVYQSLLFYLYRTHLYKAPPTTLESLVTENYKAVCTEMSMHFFGIVPQAPGNKLPFVILYTPNEMDPLYYLEQHPDENLAAISILDFALYYEFEIWPFGDVLQVLPINVNDQQIGFYLTKHSYLVDRFNNYILWLQQSGLMMKWKEWFYFEYKIFNRKENPGTNKTDLMVNLSQLTTFFVIVSLLYLIAFIVFLLELLSQRIKMLNKIFNK